MEISSSTSSSAKGPACGSVKIDLAPFTLVGATTARGAAHQSAARPLRYPGAAQLLFEPELEQIVNRGRARARHSA